MAAQNGDPCPSATVYENHNQVDYEPLKVRAVQGTGAVEADDKTQPGKIVPGACLSLFTEKEHKLVASSTADSKGRFHFAAVPVGGYRLVARSDGFCTANIPLEVVKSSPRKSKIVVRFRPAGIDTCSYGELARSSVRGATYQYDPLFTCTTTPQAGFLRLQVHR
jgi:Carboxypeptidase regulatory-like domain